MDRKAMLEQSAPAQLPDTAGYFGEYGGRFVAETLIAPLEALERARSKWLVHSDFRLELEKQLCDYAGRPTPLYCAEHWSRKNGGGRIWLKREDLLHTGAHKINNTIGQCLLARYMNKTRIIAETGAGQHGVATAATAARLGLQCRIYMGEEDMRRQALNVQRMHLFGAEVHGVSAGTRTLKDALSEALRDWVANVDDTFYVIGSVAGPHPYPRMVRDFHTVIGRETRSQCLEQIGRLPDAIVACVGGGSNAIGMFYPFLNDSPLDLYGVEAGGMGLGSGRHAAPLCAGRPGILHGQRSYLMQDEHGQIAETTSISAGLDYPGVGPEHAWLHDRCQVRYLAVEDREAVEAFTALCRYEGILPALESAHALAFAARLSRRRGPGSEIVVNLSGRGDKDMASVQEYHSRKQ